jgi:hypothetical protein
MKNGNEMLNETICGGKRMSIERTETWPASIDMLVAEIYRIKHLAKPDSDIANMCGLAIAMAKHGVHLAPAQGRKTRVVLESPYAGDTIRNVNYARAALRDCLGRGEAPIASHLLLTQVLNDDDPGERNVGLVAGTSWIQIADRVVFYQDLGFSPGMEAARQEAQRFGVPYETRTLGANWKG